MNISNYFNLPRGHSNFDFVDINTDYDTELFIDPCLIEIINTPFSYEAMYTLNDYFDSFYDLYRSNHEYSAIKQPYFAMHTKSMQQSLAMVMETTERLKPPLG